MSASTNFFFIASNLATLTPYTHSSSLSLDLSLWLYTVNKKKKNHYKLFTSVNFGEQSGTKKWLNLEISVEDGSVRIRLVQRQDVHLSFLTLSYYLNEPRKTNHTGATTDLENNQYLNLLAPKTYRLSLKREKN